jgi:diguanylate cyclase (GGDEF)-like protein
LSDAAPDSGPVQIDRVIASGFRFMRFPAALEDRFERDTGAQRCRQLATRGLLGLLLFDLFLLSDWQLMPDVADLAILMRVFLVTPLAILIIYLTLARPPAWVRESLQVLILAASSTVPPVLIFSSTDPLRMAGHPGLLLVVLFGTIVQRVRFWYALAAVVLVTAVYLATLLNLHGIAPQATLSYAMVFVGGVVFSLVASYSLEREQRLAYLLSLRAGLRNRELETVSRRDPLTGLGNRRSLEETLGALHDEVAVGEDLSVVLLDIDHFKAYNDALGHQAGDACLMRVAAVLRHELRLGLDEAFRFGGEEFLLLLRRTDLAGAIVAAERIRRAIEAAGVQHPEARSGVVTASFGAAATLIGAQIEMSELISNADAALYAAKRAGRNQVWPKPALPDREREPARRRMRA